MSTGVAREPRWSADGKELPTSPRLPGPDFDRGGHRRTEGREGLRIGSPQKLFDARLGTVIPQSQRVDVQPASRRQAIPGERTDRRIPASPPHDYQLAEGPIGSGEKP